jgi:carbamoyl-phosphate synthase large subunit
MKRILVTGAGGTPAINFTRSLAASGEPISMVGADCNKYYLQRATCPERYLVPRADDPNYISVLRDLIKETGVEFLHTQNDLELAIISKNRAQLPIKTYLPSIETVSICMNKFETHHRWAKAGLPQPRTMMVNDENDLRTAFKEFGKQIWLRDVVGAAGKGSIPVSDLNVAKAWMDFRQGWGHFTAAEYLSPQSTTWQSIWKDGELIVAQSRKRLYWEFADRAPSGVTGLTGTGVTFADPAFDELALATIHAVDPKPHGIFSVDMTMDQKGKPNPTEINIGRFFTTHEFFTRAGLNMPLIYLKIAYGEPYPAPTKKINPLPSGLAWIRGMDVTPVLVPLAETDACEKELAARLKRLAK